MKVKELQTGDRFYYPRDKKRITFKVIDKCVFNSAAGTSTRPCLNEKTGSIDDKQCRIEVIKIEPKIL